MAGSLPSFDGAGNRSSQSRKLEFLLLLGLRLTASPDLKPARSEDDGKRFNRVLPRLSHLLIFYPKSTKNAACGRSPKLEPQPEPRSVFQFQRGLWPLIAGAN